MILIIAILLALGMIFAGIAVARPRWIAQYFQKRYWCGVCYKEIASRQKFVAGFEAGQSLEGRQV